MNKEIVVLIGAGAIGQAVARRISAGKHLLVADVSEANAKAASELLSSVGYQVSIQNVDVSSREAVHALATTAANLGDVTGVIHTAGLSPTQASPQAILKVDLYGTALVLEEFGQVVTPGGAGVVIAVWQDTCCRHLAGNKTHCLHRLLPMNCCPFQCFSQTRFQTQGWRI